MKKLRLLMTSEINRRIENCQEKSYKTPNALGTVNFRYAHELRILTYIIQPDLTHFLLECCLDEWDADRYASEIMGVLYTTLLTPSIVSSISVSGRIVFNLLIFRSLHKQSKTSLFIRSTS